jgi:hypothetical protein
MRYFAQIGSNPKPLLTRPSRLAYILPSNQGRPPGNSEAICQISNYGCGVPVFQRTEMDFPRNKK